MCGGTLQRPEVERGAWGLSPRVRGNPVRDAEDLAAEGSIPACAGEPLRQAWAAQRTGVYPRVCGGTYVRGRVMAGMEGLSPRVRGNLLEGAGEIAGPGSIPACAGEP